MLKLRILAGKQLIIGLYLLFLIQYVIYSLPTPSSLSLYSFSARANVLKLDEIKALLPEQKYNWLKYQQTISPPAPAPKAPAKGKKKGKKGKKKK